MEGLLEAAARDRLGRQPWQAVATELKRRGDVRGELAELQLALEGVRGLERRELLAAEERLLRERAAELWGPLAEVGPRLPVVWRRGFLDALVVPAPSVTMTSDGTRTREELLPRELLSRVIDHDVARLCRYLSAARKPKRAPTWLERLDLGQAVLTSDLMKLPELRALRVSTLVASAPLRHPKLEHVTVPAGGPFLDVLEGAELPALKSLAVTALGATASEPAAVARALARLAPERLHLGFARMAGRSSWSGDSLRALAPIADRITALGLALPGPSIELALPRLRRLSLSISMSPGGVGAGSALPELPDAEELYVFASGVGHGPIAFRGRGRGPGAPDPAKELAASRPVQSARVLHLEAADAQLAAIADRPLERLEELAVAPMGTRHTDLSDLLFAKDSFPNVRTVSIAFLEQLPGLARSPLAARTETLSIQLFRPHAARQWLELRESFPRLRTLVVRGGHGLDAATRAAIDESAPDVIWARTNAEARRAMFDGERTEPGFPSIHG